MKTLALVVSFVIGAAAFAATPHNDDSCDIAVLPAATLLLPYFEVDLDDPDGEKTIFSITNVTNLDQIAQVTLWTDRSYPAASFTVVLTGYDVQTIDLHEVFVRGEIYRDRRFDGSLRGRFSDPNGAVNLTGCNTGIWTTLDAPTREHLRTAFTEGATGECRNIGGRHENAVGYVTVDVVDSCTSFTPADEKYWSEVLRYDNVLIGDYRQLDGRTRSAQGGPLVHIRAVPEGGTASLRRGTRYQAALPRTFYSRHQHAATPHLDGRQPLPSRFAARWIGEGAGTTSLKVWREGRATGRDSCSAYAANADLGVTEIVVFDANENAAGTSSETLGLAATSRIDVADAETFPQLNNGAPGGWIYLNLDRDWRDDEATQNWVVTTMRAGELSVDSDAVAFGNGCTPDARPSAIASASGAPIAPPRNDNGRSSGLVTIDNDASCDISLQPAATLLLPYFEVDLDDAAAANALFTITNVTPREQTARVTLWTDFAYPVATFNVPLTAYDVQSLSLYDVLSGGTIPGCGERARQLDPQLMKFAFVFGEVRGEDGCDPIGEMHENAVGYATVDVVRNCSANGPHEPRYWSDDIAYENVLIGDYQQIHQGESFAQGNTMVHIRAVPEGGSAPGAAFPRTFYGALQSAATPKLDGRQPLPSTFAARWRQGAGDSYRTNAYKIWREPRVGLAACGEHEQNGAIDLYEFVRFDEAENGTAWVTPSRGVPPIERIFTLPVTSRVSPADNTLFPVLTNGAASGWMYFNLDCRCDEFAHQNWVVTSMPAAHGAGAADVDAAALGNGCSAGAGRSEIGDYGGAVIGPAPNRR